jgi:hypothetical protein
MAGESQRRYSLDDYFAVEASSPIRHEYANGEILSRWRARRSARLLQPLKTLHEGACHDLDHEAIIEHRGVDQAVEGRARGAVKRDSRGQVVPTRVSGAAPLDFSH